MRLSVIEDEYHNGIQHLGGLRRKRSDNAVCLVPVERWTQRKKLRREGKLTSRAVLARCVINSLR